MYLFVCFWLLIPLYTTPEALFWVLMRRDKEDTLPSELHLRHLGTGPQTGLGQDGAGEGWGCRAMVLVAGDLD